MFRVLNYYLLGLQWLQFFQYLKFHPTRSEKSSFRWYLSLFHVDNISSYSLHRSEGLSKQWTTEGRKDEDDGRTTEG